MRSGKNQSFEKLNVRNKVISLLPEFNPLGWEGNGETCSNIDECTTGTHKCGPHAQCTDREGSYVCTCNGGYENIETDGGTICIGNEQIRTLQY